MPTVIDFRSDTVTRPSMQMRKLMVNAPVGDDVFYDDPTINELQSEVAKLYGKQAGILIPSGTMSNLIAFMLHCRHKGDAAFIGEKSHINNWERGNIASAASVMPMTLKNRDDGTIDLDEVDFWCRELDPHLVTNKVLSLESPHNECSGRVLRMKYIKEAKKMARKHKLKMHLDGARSFNAAAFLKIPMAEMCKDFDTVSVCMSKGLGAPIGSVLVGSEKDIK